jgi:hypothetical protein
MPCDGGVHLIKERIVNDADDGGLLVDETDGDADEGEAVDEVGGSV